MDNKSVAETLDTIGKILEIQGENRFKIRAYGNAARQIKSLPRPVKDLVAEKSIGEVPGIGAALQEKITELVETGKLNYLEQLKKKIPEGVLQMLRIPGVGPKSVRTMWQEMNLTTLESLKKACSQGKVAPLKGFGKKTEDKILKGLLFLEQHSGQFRLGDALPVAREILQYLGEYPQVKDISLAGSIRRACQTVKDIDILVGTSKPEHVTAAFLQFGGIKDVIGSGKTKTSIRLTNGIQVDLRVVEHKQFPYALLYFTGSKDHNIVLRQRAQKMGLKLNEYGIFKGNRLLQAKTEIDCYKILKLQYVPPELRENTGEIEAAEKGLVPILVARDDIQGVLHTHSTWSDGTAKIEQMAKKARLMGLKYMGLSDHSQAAHYANGLNATRLKKQWKEIDKLNKKWKDFKILKGLECDILSNGDMDMTPSLLGKLDFVIGSIHSNFTMSQTEMTSRVCKSLNNNNMHILGHPTGRLLLSREPFAIDLEEVIKTAKKERKVLELNANPHRLDLDWVHARRAGDQGVMLSINPDAHSEKGMEDIDYGIATARKAWLTKDQILNTRSWSKVKNILKRPQGDSTLAKESEKIKKSRALKIVKALNKEYGDAECALVHKSALQILVATILSAQCTDERVNIVTKDLFKKYRTAEDYANARPKDLEKAIYSTGFYRNKAKNIQGMARLLVKDHKGAVPNTMEELLPLPGVARKTANVLLGTWFKKATGIVVDTHVFRLSHRLHLSENKDPNKVEKDLLELVPKGSWIDFAHQMIWHGRRVCQARKPKCTECHLEKLCPSAGKVV